MTRVYQHPESFRPPLAFGGHGWRIRGQAALCTGCGTSVPVWSVSEGLWPLYAPQWCPHMVRALPAPEPDTASLLAGRPQAPAPAPATPPPPPANLSVSPAEQLSLLDEGVMT